MRDVLDALAAAFLFVAIVAAPSVTYKLFRISDDLHDIARYEKAQSETAEQLHDDANLALEQMAGIKKKLGK